VVGDLDGAIYVIDAQGVLLASARGHRRRVSELRAHDELVYSTSWDGTLRRWDLRAITAPIDALDAGAWGLTAADVLAQPGL
jgi:WD40 repeat protein